MALALILNMRRCPLLFIAWLLLVPPNSYNTTWGTGKIVDTDKPHKEWILIGEFESEEKCKAAMQENKIIMALTGNSDMAKRFNLGECIKK